MGMLEANRDFCGSEIKHGFLLAGAVFTSTPGVISETSMPTTQRRVKSEDVVLIDFELY